MRDHKIANIKKLSMTIVSSLPLFTCGDNKRYLFVNTIEGACSCTCNEQEMLLSNAIKDVCLVWNGL